MICIVVVALRADGRLLASLPQPGGEPGRCGRARRLARGAKSASPNRGPLNPGPLRAETHCLLAADVPADAAVLRTVIVVWPLLDVDPSSGTLSKLAANSAGDWCTLDEAASPTSRQHAALALCAVNSLRATAEAAAPRTYAGRRGNFAIDHLTAPSDDYDEVSWAAIVREAAQTNSDLAAACRAEGDAWLDGWADAIAPFDASTVPPALRRRQAFDARLVSAPFTRRYTPPTTLRLPPAPLQPDRGRVASQAGDRHGAEALGDIHLVRGSRGPDRL